jgi:hypothetical protein
MDNIDKLIGGLSGSIMASVYKSMEAIVYQCIEEEGLNKDDYFLSILPWSLIRKDGGPVERSILVRLQKKLSTSNTN